MFFLFFGFLWSLLLTNVAALPRTEPDTEYSIHIHWIKKQEPKAQQFKKGRFRSQADSYLSVVCFLLWYVAVWATIMTQVFWFITRLINSDKTISLEISHSWHFSFNFTLLQSNLVALINTYTTYVLWYNT